MKIFARVVSQKLSLAGEQHYIYPNEVVGTVGTASPEHSSMTTRTRTTSSGGTTPHGSLILRTFFSPHFQTHIEIKHVPHQRRKFLLYLRLAAVADVVAMVAFSFARQSRCGRLLLLLASHSAAQYFLFFPPLFFCCFDLF